MSKVNELTLKANKHQVGIAKYAGKQLVLYDYVAKNPNIEIRSKMFN